MGNTPGLIGKIPTPNSWKPQLDTLVKSSGVIALLEKQVGQTTVEDIAAIGKLANVLNIKKILCNLCNILPISVLGL